MNDAYRFFWLPFGIWINGFAVFFCYPTPVWFFNLLAVLGLTGLWFYLKKKEAGNG